MACLRTNKGLFGEGCVLLAGKGKDTMTTTPPTWMPFFCNSCDKLGQFETNVLVFSPSYIHSQKILASLEDNKFSALKLISSTEADLFPFLPSVIILWMDISSSAFAWNKTSSTFWRQRRCSQKNVASHRFWDKDSWVEMSQWENKTWADKRGRSGH